jgi:hypothetical protein
MMFRTRSPFGRNRRLGMESLEERSLMTATPITPSQGVAALLSVEAAVAVQTTATTANVQASQNDLGNLDRQLAAFNLQSVQTDTRAGKVLAVTADLDQRATITSAGNRIANEFNQIVAGVAAANTTFRNETAELVSAVAHGTMTPVAALAAQQVDLTAYKVSVASYQAQSAATSQFELPNMAGLTYQVEGYQGQKSLGTFHGPFDVKGVGIAGAATDFKGVATTQLSQTASLLQGSFTGASGDYLQVLETIPATPTTAVTQVIVKQPIIGGTLTAINSAVPHSDGFTVHGTIDLSFAAVGNIPAQTQEFQFAANLTAQHFLVGQLIVGGIPVGALDWGRIGA